MVEYIDCNCTISASPNNSSPEISPTIAAISHRLPHLKPLNPTSAFISESKSLPSVDDAAIFDNLPLRYRRRTISQEEMEYIEVNLILTLLFGNSNPFHGKRGIFSWNCTQDILLRAFLPP